MATVSDILSMASKLSGLRAESAEQDIALMAANKTYLRACLDCELSGDDVTYTVTAHSERLAASAIAGVPVLRLQHLRLSSSQQNLPVQQVSRQEIQDYRAVSNGETGIPEKYSVAYVGGEPTVDFFPGVNSGDVIRMSYLIKPAELTTANSPVYMPEMFHHDILTNAVVAALLERDGKIEESGMWTARSLEAMVRLEEYLGQMGGTANRAYIAPEVGRGRYPDQR